MSDSDNGPRTAEEFMALPEGGSFGAEIRVIDGKRVRVPIAPRSVPFFIAPETIMWCHDRDGNPWRLGQCADGRWFRQRMYV
jgi:DUF1365 family protein